MGRTVGIFPAVELARRARLFEAIGAIFDLKFEGRNSEVMDGLDGAIQFPAASPVEAAQIPTLNISSVSRAEVSRSLRFTTASTLDYTIRGRTLVENRAPAVPVRPLPGDAILATCEGKPVWTTCIRNGAPNHLVAVAPDEVVAGETLGDQLVPGRFLALMALLEFARCLDAGWSKVPLDAAFIFDDPNLHAPSYGHIGFRRLAAHARRFGYHAVMASIPRDLGYASPAAIHIFRSHSDVLSLTVHGNNHLSNELIRERSPEEDLALAAQSLSRTMRFEQRTGIVVSHVMCAPHEVCGQGMMRALFRVGFDGLAIEQVSLRSALDEPSPHLGILPADRVCNGLSAVPRQLLGTSQDALVLTAFLRQPLLIYGHHWDLARGYDRLAAIADFIHGLGDVHWGPLSHAVRDKYSWRSRGDRLEVRLYGRTASIACDTTPASLELVIPSLASREGLEVSIAGGAWQRMSSESRQQIPLPSGLHASIDVELRPIDAAIAASVAPPNWAPWPAVRRAATEIRDRMSVLSGNRR
jgi:hypothetical protein